MTVEIDWKGIRRTARRMGGEGENVLLLRGNDLPSGDALDDALPPYDDDCPANGGWSPSPQGWVLLLEPVTLRGVDAWIENVAERLGERGVDATLTGANIAQRPAWAIQMNRVRPPSWSASMYFHPEPVFRLWDGWSGPDESLAEVVDFGADWLTEPGGRIMVRTEGVGMWFTGDTARTVMRGQLRKRSTFAMTFEVKQREVRTLTGRAPGELDLTVHSDLLDPRATATHLMNALRNAPRTRLSIGIVSNRRLSDLTFDDTHYSAFAFTYHPNLWDEFTADPCGFQILTPRHLDKAADLTAWTTTRLDDDHYILEARDLEPWYGKPRAYNVPVNKDTLDQARHDFGDMILTPEYAAEHGLDIKPPPRTY